MNSKSERWRLFIALGLVTIGVFLWDRFSPFRDIRLRGPVCSTEQVIDPQLYRLSLIGQVSVRKTALLTEEKWRGPSCAGFRSGPQCLQFAADLTKALTKGRETVAVFAECENAASGTDHDKHLEAFAREKASGEIRGHLKNYSPGLE